MLHLIYFIDWFTRYQLFYSKETNSMYLEFTEPKIIFKPPGLTLKIFTQWTHSFYSLSTNIIKKYIRIMVLFG